jgi:hypothetical protein
VIGVELAFSTPRTVGERKTEAGPNINEHDGYDAMECIHVPLLIMNETF